MSSPHQSPPAPFRDELWSALAPAVDRILAHPFIAGLTSGSLDRAAFRFYVVQDAIYLRDYARALALLAARAPDEATILHFARDAVEAIEVERELHAGFFAEFGIEEAAALASEPAPTCLAYTSYLLRVAHGGSFAEALGAVLPCYWIYWVVGKALLERGSPDSLYRRWIETYGGPEFGATVDSVLAVVDAIGSELGPAERARVAGHARQTARYEWLFWDMGYRQERWPIEL